MALGVEDKSRQSTTKPPAPKSPYFSRLRRKIVSHAKIDTRHHQSVEIISRLFKLKTAALAKITCPRAKKTHYQLVPEKQPVKSLEPHYEKNLLPHAR
jgi:hypothetical protein